MRNVSSQRQLALLLGSALPKALQACIECLPTLTPFINLLVPSPLPLRLALTSMPIAPQLYWRSCLHHEAWPVVQAREVHSLEDLQGHSCPSAILINSRTGPPSQVRLPTQVLAPILHTCQGTKTTVDLNRKRAMAAPVSRPGPQSCLLIV